MHGVNCIGLGGIFFFLMHRLLCALMGEGRLKKRTLHLEQGSVAGSFMMTLYSLGSFFPSPAQRSSLQSTETTVSFSTVPSGLLPSGSGHLITKKMLTNGKGIGEGEREEVARLIYEERREELSMCNLAKPGTNALRV